MSRESLSARVQRGPDDGGALVAVIGIMVVLTILVTTIVTTSLFNVRMTTETRAGVQARAAAEAGVDYVRAQIAAGKCTTGTVSSPSGSPRFTVTIHPSSAGTATSSLPAGCPTASSKSVVLLAKGGAASSGVGSTNGNVRTVEALIESKVSAAPVFNAAIYSGQDASISTDLTLKGSGADVITGGSWHCSAKQNIDGNVYAVKDVTFQSGPCAIKGSVYAGGAFSCPSTSSVGQNLYVQGKASFSTAHCSVGGEIWTGGDVTESRGIKVTGDLTIKGNMPVDGSSISVGGNIALQGTWAGGPSGGWWYSEFKKQYPAAKENQTVGTPPSGESATSMVFPKITQSDPMWTGFVNKSWIQSTKAGLADPSSSMSMCQMGWGGSQFSAPLKVTENTVFDVTSSSECSSQTLVLGAGLTIQLSGDAVIFARAFQMNGDVRVESVDGKDHSLYLVTPYPAAQTSCQSTVGNSAITFTSGSWTQSDKTSVLLYSGGDITFTSAPQLRGQIYGCKFSASTPVNLTFVKSGASSSDPSASKPALKYVRDVAG